MTLAIAIRFLILAISMIAAFKGSKIAQKETTSLTHLFGCRPKSALPERLPLFPISRKAQPVNRQRSFSLPLVYHYRENSLST